MYSRRFGTVVPPVVNPAITNDITDESDNYSDDVERFIADEVTAPINEMEVSHEYEVTEEPWQNIDEEDADDISEENEIQDVISEPETTDAEVKEPVKVEAEEQEEHAAKFTVETGEIDEIVEKQEDQLGEYDPTLDLSNYKFPTFSLLNKYECQERTIDEEEQSANKKRIETT